MPCYNEEDGIIQSLQTLQDKLATLKNSQIIAQESFIICIDDGSEDNSFSLLQDYTSQTPYCTIIKLTKNYGGQKALLAGLQYAKGRCDCCISIDADLQQDIEKFPEFIKKYNEGAQIVLGIRNDRKTDTFFKKASSLGFYRLMQMLGTPAIPNHSEYRLLGSKALEKLAAFQESNIFLRGLIFELGFKIDYVYFDVKPRTIGASKYSLSKMLSLAIDGITSFSTRPLHLISLIGMVVFLMSFLLGIYSLYTTLVLQKSIPGWASIALPLYFLGGVQLLALGVIGEYIGKIYAETKHRPRYLIESITQNDSPLKSSPTHQSNRHLGRENTTKNLKNTSKESNAI
ncbi:glycosyltransferase family 2 protein [Helicobacter sp. 11S02596-1]|uniref:glycosyltransferase family 2 protein n=1 Tax=Helicobacter sp. 11S02596-1 TaxID=1476194 RepID=UPI000BCDD681|nr:glycosyltransferase family 2 protein [Helicobacter sp. 11S02596-1]PAF43945.1 hypothetical protein BJI48_03925 [Helicobacter sp. 11S02596-1]